MAKGSALPLEQRSHPKNVSISESKLEEQENLSAGGFFFDTC
jgi:hypothetical protein